MTRAAEKLKIAVHLERTVGRTGGLLGQDLFERRGQQLHLTDAGRVALEHAGTIFTTGHELITRFSAVGETRQRILHIWRGRTASKNLQFDFIQPILADTGRRSWSSPGASRFDPPVAGHLVDVGSLQHRRADQNIGSVQPSAEVVLVWRKETETLARKIPQNTLSSVPLFPAEPPEQRARRVRSDPRQGGHRTVRSRRSGRHGTVAAPGLDSTALVSRSSSNANCNPGRIKFIQRPGT